MSNFHIQYECFVSENIYPPLNSFFLFYCVLHVGNSILSILSLHMLKFWFLRHPTPPAFPYLTFNLKFVPRVDFQEKQPWGYDQLAHKISDLVANTSILVARRIF